MEPTYLSICQACVQGKYTILRQQGDVGHIFYVTNLLKHKDPCLVFYWKHGFIGRWLGYIYRTNNCISLHMPSVQQLKITLTKVKMCFFLWKSVHVM